MNKNTWTVVVVVALVLLLAASLFGNWGYGGWGMTLAPGASAGVGPGMMGNWGFAPFGWIGMIFMWLIPIGFLVLTVLGIVWLVRAVGGGGNPTAPPRACPSCGRGVQSDWQNCPHCGATLTTP